MITAKPATLSNRGSALSMVAIMLVLLAPSPVAIAEKNEACTYTENKLRSDLLLLHSQLQQGSLSRP